MCAGTVVTPPGDTSALIVSITSRSRSVALNASLERSARISTLARIGMVLRRSTTRCTWDSDLRSSARSTVSFMRSSLEREGKLRREDGGGPAPASGARELAPGDEIDPARRIIQGRRQGGGGFSPVTPAADA